MYFGIHKVDGSTVINGKSWCDLARAQELMVMRV